MASAGRRTRVHLLGLRPQALSFLSTVIASKVARPRVVGTSQARNPGIACLTVTVPRIDGCTLQWQLKFPELSNVTEKDPPLGSPTELHDSTWPGSDVVVRVTASPLVHTTVSPTSTVRTGGSNEKPWMDTLHVEAVLPGERGGGQGTVADHRPQRSHQDVSHELASSRRRGLHGTLSFMAVYSIAFKLPGPQSMKASYGRGVNL